MPKGDKEKSKMPLGKRKKQDRLGYNPKHPPEKITPGKKAKNSAGETELSKGKASDPPVHYKRKDKK